MEQAFQFCEARVREVDKDRFLATLFAPAKYRGPLFALYAFDAEIAQVRDRISSPLPGEVRLQWWRDVLSGTGPGDAAANPIAAGLLETVRGFALPLPALLDLIDARTFDLYDDPMATLADLERYALATAAVPIQLAAAILNDGAQSGHDDALRHAGIAVALTGMLQRLPLQIARGQNFVPADILSRHQGAAADLAGGRVSAPLRAALAEVRRIVRGHLAALRAELPALPPRIIPAFLPIALVGGTLQGMDGVGYDPLQPPVVPQWRRQWALWRAARNPRSIAGA